MSAQLSRRAENTPAYPEYLADLLGRAALKLQAHWPCCAIEFDWFADGEDVRYLAKLEWPAGMLAPRVSVYDCRSGEFRCGSAEGAPSEIDPHIWCVDPAVDAVDRELWRQGLGGLPCSK